MATLVTVGKSFKKLCLNAGHTNKLDLHYGFRNPCLKSKKGNACMKTLNELIRFFFLTSLIDID